MKESAALPEALRATAASLAALMRVRRFRLFALSIGLAYAIFYLAAIQNIVYKPGIGLNYKEVQVNPDWPLLFWKPIRPFTYEPIATLRITDSILVLISVPNLLVAASLSVLVALNLSLAAYGLSYATRSARAARTQSWVGAVLALPSLLASSACCVPTAILLVGPLLALGSGFASLLAAVSTVLFPISLGGLTLGLLWAGRNLAPVLIPRAVKQVPPVL